MGWLISILFGACTYKYLISIIVSECLIKIGKHDIILHVDNAKYLSTGILHLYCFDE